MRTTRISICRSGKPQKLPVRDFNNRCELHQYSTGRSRRNCSVRHQAESNREAAAEHTQDRPWKELAEPVNPTVLYPFTSPSGLHPHPNWEVRYTFFQSVASPSLIYASLGILRHVPETTLLWPSRT